ncbi:MAG TPA: DUF6089 family protein [Tenuifilaceae bacterium]|nr:DUF6089 family protein [Tenuifilaceae bacterium]HRX67382.1 DUF6089 family protein [Tenuifilaceae bacterium]
MRIFLLALCLSYTLFGFSQERKDIGLLAGTSYYLGDYNPGTQFYQPSPLFSILGKYNFNDFYTLRLSASYGWLKGSPKSDAVYNPISTEPFSKQLLALELDGEINFMSFDSRQHEKQNFSPYLLLGIGVAYEGSSLFPHIPIGFGVKYSPRGRFTFGAEWRLHKTFNDNIDGHVNITDIRKSFIHNNDWFGIAGLFVTYRLENSSELCPTYR